MQESALPGGFVNQVVRVGPTVRRTPGPRAQYVGGLLALFDRRGWSGAPQRLGMDEQGREIFDHIEGQVPLTVETLEEVRTDASLARVAWLVREFHDLTQGTPQAGDQEVVCHNDLSPRNTVYAPGWQPLAFIDWDLAAPGARIHDVAHVCWQYLDLGPSVSDVPEAARRIALICSSYGLADPSAIVDAILWWQDRCWRGIEAGASRGERAMVGLRERGVVGEVRAAYGWVAAHRGELGAGLR